MRLGWAGQSSEIDLDIVASLDWRVGEDDRKQGEGES